MINQKYGKSVARQQGIHTNALDKDMKDSNENSIKEYSPITQTAYRQGETTRFVDQTLDI